MCFYACVNKMVVTLSELISDKCRDAIEAVEAEGSVASAAMIGDTVFVIGNSEALKEFGEVRESRISVVGANCFR